MSTAVFALAKKEDKYEDVDFETLLEQLSPEEIEELSLELIDPDVSCRCSQESKSQHCYLRVATGSNVSCCILGISSVFSSLAYVNKLCSLTVII